MRSNISYVSQDPILYNDTIYNNLVFGNMNMKQSDVEEVAKKLKIHDYIERMSDGYQTQIGERGTFLSGGQKQLICTKQERALCANRRKKRKYSRKHFKRCNSICKLACFIV